jgi:hypothetical protein
LIVLGLTFLCPGRKSLIRAMMCAVIIASGKQFFVLYVLGFL